MSAFSRRLFLRSAGALAALGVVPGFLGRAVAASTSPGGRTLVLVFLRGGADGLSIVPPLGDPAYRAARPTLALAAPGREGGALRLDDVFGLHPALAPLLPLWREGTLGVVHATGLPGASRSHFDAQDFCESGTPGTKSTADGWLNRAVQRAAGPDGAFRVVAVQPTLPRVLVGDAPAVAMSSLAQFRLPGGPGGAVGFDALYAGAVDTALRTTGIETFEALREAGSARLGQLPPANGAEYGTAPIARRLQDVARLIRSGVGLQVAVTDMGGWDTHVGEGAEKGQLASRLAELGAALASFARDLGPRWADTRVVVMTEFGRTARENGNRGTDHGTASVMLVLGGGIRGGHVVGGYRGLARSELFEERDLAIGTDVRTVLWEATRAQLGVRDSSTVFPGFTPGAAVLG